MKSNIIFYIALVLGITTYSTALFSGRQTFINESDIKPLIGIYYPQLNAEYNLEIGTQPSQQGIADQQWISNDYPGCIAKIDIRDSETGNFLKMKNGQDAQLKIYNVNPNKKTKKLLFVGCDESLTWTFSGSNGSYSLQPPHGVETIALML